jgi:type I restriction-modification system DNA methylase subunit
MSTLSKNLTKLLTDKEHKTDGIYFTPPQDVQYIVNKIFKYKKDIVDILEPSCGSCEFIRYIDDKFKNLNIHGYEINTTIYKHIKDLKFRNKVSLYKQDFLKHSSQRKYDLIIGNPPFYEITYDSKYFNTKKINIYLLFIVESLKLLKTKGILAFVLPVNFLNNKYCNEFRKCLKSNYKVLSIHLFEESNYINTSQATCLVMIQNTKNFPSWEKYSIKISDTLFFNSNANISKLNLIKSNINLNSLECSVKVGNVLWNEHKDKLYSSNHTSKKDKVRLIYNTDINNGKITTNTNDNNKKGYIDNAQLKKKPQSGPLLIVNRGYGTGKYKFEYAIYNSKIPVFFENHVLIITPPHKNDLQLLENIKKSFDDKRTLSFIETIFTNNAINVHEMEYIIPIYNL